MASNGMSSSLPAWLRDEHVHIADPVQVSAKLQAMCASGTASLQVISDFDYTMSRFHRDGARRWTTHAIFDNNSRKISNELADELHALREHYMAIEFDSTLTSEEKTPHMIEWWTRAHSRISGMRLPRKELRHFVDTAEVECRDGVPEWMDILQKNSVPLLVFSAGLGDLITMFFASRNIPQTPNMHLVSNMMIFDEADDTVNGFTEPLIHTFNKNATVISRDREPWFRSLEGRPNILLLGDSQGDVNMCTGDAAAAADTQVLKVGFLNMKKDELLEVYKKIYDIVLFDDQTFKIPQAIIDSICAQRLE